MNHTKRTQLAVFASLAFGQGQPDAFRMDEPRISGSTICGITSLFGVRDVLRAPEGDEGGGGAAGDEKKFSQSEVDAIVQKRVAGINEKLKAAEAAAAKVADIEKKLAEAESEREKATDAEALKGKNEIEREQHKHKKAQELIAKLEADRAKDKVDFEAQLAAAHGSTRDVVKSAAVKDALFGAGLSTAKGTDRLAAQAFLADAEIEFSEDGKSVTKVTLAGKSFDKLADAGKHFVSEYPQLAAAPSGGAGTQRGAPGAARSGDVSKTSADDDFAVGMSANPTT